MRSKRAFDEQVLVDASYIRSLREQCKTYRLGKKAAEEHTHLVREQLEKRLIEAEMKLALMKSGCIDLEWSVFLNLGNVRLMEDGSLAGAEEEIQRLKLAKPYVFKDSK